MIQPDDWRLQGQDKYLFQAELKFQKYSDRKTNTDHDHCEFCMNKFSDSLPGCFTDGYTTIDDYHWVCINCFQDFNEVFRWVIINK
jgi:hypothetical protein